MATMQEVDPSANNADKFKRVGFELLDIGLHYGNQGVEKI